MSDTLQGTQNAAQAAAPKGAPPNQGNPAFRMMGLPRLRAKLPSRNWTIFLTVVGSFSAAVIYDRRHKRAAQQHWCDAVSHLSRGRLEANQLPRKLTVYLAAPPGDGLRPSREFFVEYIKPMLVAAAVDWEVVEGRKEGDVRAALAKRIRRTRVKNGESTVEELEESTQDIIDEIRRSQGVQPVDSSGGDLVLGRHTWKEYIRGLHEGWLGPLSAPPGPEANPEDAPFQEDFKTTAQDAFTNANDPSKTVTEAEGQSDSSSDLLGVPQSNGTPADSDNVSKPSEVTPDPPKPEEDPKPKPKPSPTPPYILPESYSIAEISPTIPSTFPPSVAVNQPHLLGFFNTPIRIYRFLTRRWVADDVGRQVATLLLAGGSRPYQSPLTGVSTFAADSVPAPELSSTERDESSDAMWEMQSALMREEADWHKVARQPDKEGEEKERPWKEQMFIDNRIAERMCTPDNTTANLVQTKGDLVQQSESLEEDASTEKGHAREWRGGADPVLRKVSWGQWFLEATGFDDPKEPRGEGSRDGLVGEEP